MDAEEGTVRSAASYKQFSATFFKDLKVVSFGNICELIIASRKRMEQKGLRFEWLNFRTIASGIQEIFNATKLNQTASFVSSLFTGPQKAAQLSPH